MRGSLSLRHQQIVGLSWGLQFSCGQPWADPELTLAELV